MKEFSKTGEWSSRYFYRSGEVVKPISSGHTVVFENEKDRVIGRSMPQEDGSELVLDLRYVAGDHILTGSWQEKTSQTGKYNGAVFYGELQLILNEADTMAIGRWIGFNSSRSQVKDGVWWLEKKQS